MLCAKQEREFASNCQSVYQNTLLQQKFVDSLQAKKNEHDKTRKQLRDLWAKDKKRLVSIRDHLLMDLYVFSNNV